MEGVAATCKRVTAACELENTQTDSSARCVGLRTACISGNREGVMLKDGTSGKQWRSHDHSQASQAASLSRAAPAAELYIVRLAYVKQRALGRARVSTIGASQCYIAASSSPSGQ